MIVELPCIHYDPNLLNIVKHGIYSNLEVTDPLAHLVEAVSHHLPQKDQLVQDHRLSIW